MAWERSYTQQQTHMYTMKQVYLRSGIFFFCIRNVRTFNFHRVAKWRKLNAHVRNFCAFNICHLNNWRKKFLTVKISWSLVYTCNHNHVHTPHVHTVRQSLSHTCCYLMSPSTLLFFPSYSVNCEWAKTAQRLFSSCTKDRDFKKRTQDVYAIEKVAKEKERDMHREG